MALFVRDPVPIGPLVTLPREPIEPEVTRKVPRLFIVPPLYEL